MKKPGPGSSYTFSHYFEMVLEAIDATNQESSLEDMTNYLIGNFDVGDDDENVKSCILKTMKQCMSSNKRVVNFFFNIQCLVSSKNIFFACDF